MSLAVYIDHLQLLISPPERKMTDDQASWFSRVASIRKRQRAYGRMDEFDVCKELAKRQSYVSVCVPRQKYPKAEILFW